MLTFLEEYSSLVVLWYLAYNELANCIMCVCVCVVCVRFYDSWMQPIGKF